MTAISSSSEHDDRIGAGVLPACVQTAFSMQRAGAGMSVGNGVSSSVVLIQLRRVPARHDACCVHVTSSPSRLRTRTNTSSSVAAVSTFGRSDMTNGRHLCGGGNHGSPVCREKKHKHGTQKCTSAGTRPPAQNDSDLPQSLLYKKNTNTCSAPGGQVQKTTTLYYTTHGVRKRGRAAQVCTGGTGGQHGARGQRCAISNRSGPPSRKRRTGGL